MKFISKFFCPPLKTRLLHCILLYRWFTLCGCIEGNFKIIIIRCMFWRYKHIILQMNHSTGYIPNEIRLKLQFTGKNRHIFLNTAITDHMYGILVEFERVPWKYIMGVPGKEQMKENRSQIFVILVYQGLLYISFLLLLFVYLCFSSVKTIFRISDFSFINESCNSDILFQSCPMRQ